MKIGAFVFASCLCLAAACGPGERTGGGGDDDGIADGQLEGTEVGDGTPHILILDFRSGWWAGSAGEFHKTVLTPLRADGGNLTIEFHHMTVGSDVKCVYSPASPNGACENVTMSQTPSVDEVIARFDYHKWNTYNQVWILSGSEKDMSDVQVNGDLFGTFLGQGGSSCNSVYIGAGDGFIDHGNVIAQRLGIGTILSTDYASPGFFFGTGSPTVESRMTAGTQMVPHELFTNVNVIADGVGNMFLQHTHGDSLVNNPMVQVIAHDSTGRPAIGVGELDLPDGTKRPFVIDAGNQRYYASTVEPDTLTLLKNIRRYLAKVGCSAVFE